MSSSQVYPTLPGAIDPVAMCGDESSGIATSVWYPPTTTYTFPDTSYLTPFPSSTMESQPWLPARASVPEIHYPGSYSMQHTPQPTHLTPQLDQQTIPPHCRDPGRPRSSPSTFGPSAESIQWTTTAGLGISTYTSAGQPTPVTSTFPPAVFTNFPNEELYTTSSPPELRQPQPRRPYAPIAPNPDGVAAAAKRKREDDDRQESTPATTTGASSASSKRRKRTSSLISIDLSDEDRFLVTLKEDENLPWKDIASRFQTDRGKAMQVAALQMRYKRLRERFRQWEEQDVQALKSAHDYWEKYKWEIISAKMLEFNVAERWPARQCARKWQEVEASTTIQVTTAGMTPASISQISSPIEGPVQFTFMPMQ